jgi:hypothetical protein
MVKLKRPVLIDENHHTKLKVEAAKKKATIESLVAKAIDMFFEEETKDEPTTS